MDWPGKAQHAAIRMKGARAAMKGLSKAYYLKPVKIIRDSVHGYINLTKFDLVLIDTVPFQRLCDVRQLTCQHVYPGARHTRFEHSLGVLELMRNSIKYLNRNGYLSGEFKEDKREGKSDGLEGTPDYAREGSGKDQAGSKHGGEYGRRMIHESLEFNASVAALFHDVGHCPFSHMGEAQFEKDSVKDELITAVKELADLNKDSDLVERLKNEKKPGAVHEQLSCIVILRKYRDILKNLTQKAEKGECACEIEVDFELIVRSILGLEYKVDTTESFKDNRLKNVIVRLLNSKIFDVDKLDYIMRDSYMTRVGTPSIDTQRLFRNMYLDDEDKCNLIFTSKAVPALQNMIDARDGLYMYVYNHHAVVYSDFLDTYISRRMSHNLAAFHKGLPEGKAASLDQQKLRSLGLVPKTYLFSVEAVVKENRSDSAWISLLNSIYIKLVELLDAVKRENPDCGELDEDSEWQRDELIKKLNEELDSYRFKNPAGGNGKENEMALRIYNVMRLIQQCMKRQYLKPWWKTVFEFKNFVGHHFQDDRVRRQAIQFISDKGDCGLRSDEMRSQIAKHVGYITRQLQEQNHAEEFGLLECLYDGDFFVVQRSTNFFSPNTIEELEIALKSNEILGTPVDVNRQMNQYYLKTLTNIIPQKIYASIYDKEGFYVFSKRPQVRKKDEKTEQAETAEQTEKQDVDVKRQEQKKLEKHYKLLEDIFVFVVKYLVDQGEQRFIERFQCEDKTAAKTAEEDSKEAVYDAFLASRQ